MRRRIALIAAVAAVAGVSACSAPANNPCLYDNGLRYSHLSSDGHTLLLVCRDGKVIVRHQ